MKKIELEIRDCSVTIFPEVSPENFRRFNAFDVRVVCNPAFCGSDKELMVAVCKALSAVTGDSLELKTFYVVRNASFDANHRVEEITFQVITPLDSQWYC